jgi:hypothetical protein
MQTMRRPLAAYGVTVNVAAAEARGPGLTTVTA